MSGGKKTTTSSNQNTATTTTLPEWMTQAGQANYNQAAAYVNGPDAVWSGDKAAAYTNPYTQQVIDRTKAGMARDNAVEMQGVGDAASAAHAYGGTRQAVLEGQLMKDQQDRMLNYEAGANADAYNTARSNFEADRAAKLGGYQSLMSILQGTPRNVSTTGTSTGSATQKQSGSFLDTVLGLGQLGLSAASTFSDPRLKKHVSLIERMANGLGIYRFRYLWERSTEPEHIGVMADEVATIMPEALGPVISGFMTVNYDKLAGAL